MSSPSNETLPFLTSDERLKAFQLITDGCSHLWSKNKLQKDKLISALETLIPLTVSDPYFLAHLTSYALTRTQNKDLQVLLTYVSSLSAADGTPFSAGSEYLKPNLRYVSGAALHKLDPKLAARVLEVAQTKYAVPQVLNNARHFSNTLRTAIRKYLKYRENNLPILRGVKKAGLANTIKFLYRRMHLSPSDEAASVLRWAQKGKDIQFENSVYKELQPLDDLQIAARIRQDKLPVLGVLGALPRPVSPVIAVALLEQATGNQAVILRKTFEDAGVLTDPEVMALYGEKVKSAKTALDRAETLSATASEAVKKVLTEARSESRKEATVGLGKVYLHLDFSPSMDEVRKFAVERGVIFAECVNDPANNFRWGYFDTYGEELPLPDKFVKDAFAQILFSRNNRGGGTNIFALYDNARQFGADVDVIVTDQEHNAGNLELNIKTYHSKYPDRPKPKTCVIINYGRSENTVKDAYEVNGVPVAILKPDTLTESSLVVEAVKTAMQGPVAVVDNIMETPLLDLPDYYYAI